ncbi:MAG TPA: AMP-binding protein [Methylomirabilota bacterium]|nr:AMP-binding protein [Methylomirabilota bacterium]
MTSILGLRRYPDVRDRFRWDALWELFDGDRTRLNLAHECVDRHVGKGTALRIQLADGRREEHDFGALAEWSSRFAHVLEEAGVARGDRVAIMLEPSLAFYGALFGTMKRGAVAVPLFTLFGPDGLALRVDDCHPRLLLVEREAARWRERFPAVTVLAIDALRERLRAASPRYTPETAPDDLALFQYTSGTTRALPEAVRHTHRAVVTLMVAALYGIGLAPGDRYFCPSSPAWGHGLWHGTIAPLALGLAVGAYAGKFDGRRIVDALHAFGITNLAAAPTVYRMLRESGVADGRRFAPRKLSFTGEPMDGKTWDFVKDAFGVSPCSMYGSTEVGVIIVDYPGFEGHEVRRGALGKAAPGWEVAVIGDAGPLPPGELGEIAVRRRGEWFRVKDRGWMDADGYFFHAGRSDDVIISAGWTMSALEIEQALLAHPDVREAAVIGVPDELRGQIPKACIVAPGKGPAFAAELREFVKTRLSQHEYPRAIEIVGELPKTPAGKIDRKTLRDRKGA